MSHHPEPARQISDRQQALSRERAPAGRDHHEQVRCRHISPPCWQREQLPVLVMQPDPVLTPVQFVLDELEVAAGQRVERVSHTGTSVPVTWIECS